MHQTSQKSIQDEVASNEVVEIEKSLLGNVATYVRLEELEKRSLLHVHWIFFFNEVSKQHLKGPENVDELLCARSPSAQDQDLWNLVMKYSIHATSCPWSNPSAFFMKNATGQKGFMKELLNETYSVEFNQILRYRRHFISAGGEMSIDQLE